MSFRSTFGRAAACRLSLAATLLVAASSGFAADCKYKRVGTLPYTWVGDEMLVDASIGGRELGAQIDTGGAGVTVFEDAATRLGLSLAHLDDEFYGVGGKSAVWRARLRDFRLGRFEWDRAVAEVVPRSREAVDDEDRVDVVVGANVLLQDDLEIAGDALRFYEPAACDGASLAYWGEDVPWLPILAKARGDRSVEVMVQIDGVPVRAEVDTGSPASILDLAVARRLGFDPDKSRPEGEGGGFGPHRFKEWRSEFGAIVIGPETVHRPNLRIGDLWAGARADTHTMYVDRMVDDFPQMLLGADFVRTHRLLFAMGQRRLYFSYVGGQPFVRPSAPPASAARDGTVQ